MKKNLCLVLALCLTVCLLFCACGKKSETKEPEVFTAPEGYVSVVQVTINPTVNLYLDADEVILAVEYVNDDAKECYEKIEKDLVGSKLADGVENVIKTAEADGYLDENKAVTIDVVESKVADEKLDILSVATTAADTYIAENKIEAEVKLTEETKKEVEEKEAEEKAQAEKEKAEKEKAEKEKAEKEAAEKAAAEKEKKNPQKNLKKNVEYTILRQGETEEVLTGIHMKFKDDGMYSYAMVPYLNDPYGEGDFIMYNGKKYFVAGGGGGAGHYTLTDEKIILTEAFEMTLKMTADGKLVVDSLAAADDFFKVGDILTIQ
ncbi:MAG: hypothetical protein IKL44_06955 [Clostridia bacterium]|nr:hypothetical protein [Clostridia bacterium]